MKKTAFLLFLLLKIILPAQAEEVKFTGSANSTVAIGEQFVLVYNVNAEASRFSGPSFNNFSVLAGPNSSTSSSIQIINGSVSQTVSYRYTYYLTANSEGTYTIPPASVFVNGRKYFSNQITIKVIKGNRSNQTYSNNRNQHNSQRQEAEDFSSEISGQDVFIKAQVNKSNPYQGEQIILTYKLYTKVQISQYVINKSSTNNGFWSQDLTKENSKPEIYTETVNGEKYQVAEIRKVALFPQKSGKLTISPIQVEALAQVVSKSRRHSNDPFFDDFFSDFFGPSVQNVKKTLRSNNLVINVKPLPASGQPSDYSGAVGNFNLKSEIDRTSLKANESVTLKLTVFGSGNLKLIDKLDAQLPPDFEIYDPKTTDRINTSNTGISGSRTFEYLMIPRNPGTYKIKPVVFTYFDLQKNKYITLYSPEYTINVTKGDGTQPAIAYSSQEDVKMLASDIRFIRSQHFVLSPVHSSFFGSGLFYLLLALPIVLFALFIILWRNQIKQRRDVAKMKNKKANKVAVQRLKKASVFLASKKVDEFYEEISKALWGYLSDKFTIPLAELSLDIVNNSLVEKKVGEESIKEFTEALNECEFARFAPGEPLVNMESVYSKAMNIIIKIEKELK